MPKTVLPLGSTLAQAGFRFINTDTIKQSSPTSLYLNVPRNKKILWEHSEGNWWLSDFDSGAVRATGQGLENLRSAVSPPFAHTMYYRVTKKDGELIDLTAGPDIQTAILKLIPPGREREVGMVKARCEALSKYAGFEVVDWELNDYPQESDFVCSKCGREMVGAKSLCCEAPPTTPSAFRNKIPAVPTDSSQGR